MHAVSANANLPPAPAGAAVRPALLLACGNCLRQDDGVGLRIAEAMEPVFPASRLRIVAAQQFTPEMAADLAATDLVIFVDACASEAAGAIRVVQVVAKSESVETHRLDPPGLMAIAETLCGHAPARAFMVTVGASSFGYGEDLSGPLRQAVPQAVRLVTHLVGAFTKST